MNVNSSVITLNKWKLLTELMQFFLIITLNEWKWMNVNRLVINLNEWKWMNVNRLVIAPNELKWFNVNRLVITLNEWKWINVNRLVIFLNDWTLLNEWMQIFYSSFGMNDFSWEFQLPCSISRKRPTSGSRQSIIGFIPNFVLLSEEAKRRQQKLLYNKLGFQIHFSLLV